MKSFLLPLFAFAFSAFAAVTPPSVTLETSATNLTVTESYVITVRVSVPPLPGKLRDVSPFPKQGSSPFGFFGAFDEGSLRPQLRGELPDKHVRFSIETAREGENWTLSFVSGPLRAERPGRVPIGPLHVRVPVYTGEAVRSFFGVRNQTRDVALSASPIYIEVSEPPEEGRPASWCGAIGKAFNASAQLDASVCTAGDPLVLSLAVNGDAPLDTYRTPDLAAAVKSPSFRVDALSAKTETLPDGKRWTWRVRALKAGTTEFPAVELAWFDVSSRQYRTVRTAPIPLQVMAGEQASLASGGETESDDDAFPMPDGLDLDFPDNGTADFTLQRAVSLALRADGEKAFAAAADAYSAWLEARKLSWLDAVLLHDAKLNARHFANLAALQTMANRPREALFAIRRAEWFTGASPSTVRTVRAARARLLKDPRADLPAVRILAPFFFRFNLLMRVAVGFGVLLAVGLVFAVASKLGKRLALIALVLFPFAANAQMRFSFNSMDNSGASKLKAELALSPSEIVVGQPAAFIVRFSGDGGTVVEASSLQVGGLPSDATGIVEYGELQAVSDNVFRVPVRFLAPFEGTVNPVFAGMAGTQRKTRFGSFSSSSSFRVSAPSLKLAVVPLPETGRPADFSGAIGKDFRLSLALAPNRVHPGDLVKATIRLTFDGHLPSNAVPSVAGLEGFRVYEAKEISRSSRSAVWEQMVIPQSAAATNEVKCSLSLYDLAAKSYRTETSRPARLAFVSSEKAATQNVSVLVDSQPSSAPTAKGTAVVLRFAPSDCSPAIAKIPAGTPIREVGRRGEWKRLAAPDATGWAR